jgi:hypothetical protein
MLIVYTITAQAVEKLTIDDRTINCITLTDEDTYIDWGNGSVTFNRELLPVISNDTLGDPIVCPPSLNYELFYNATTVFRLPSIFYLPVSAILNGVAIILWELLKCYTKRKTVSVYNIVLQIYSATLFLTNIALIINQLLFPLSLLKVYCIHIGFALHYLILAECLALSCSIIELARVSIRRRLSLTKERLLILIYFLITWVVPLVLLAINLAIYYGSDRQLVQYGLTADKKLKCWINEENFSISFLFVPIILSVLVSIAGLGLQIAGVVLQRIRIRQKRRNSYSTTTSTQSSTKSLVSFFTIVNTAQELDQNEDNNKQEEDNRQIDITVKFRSSVVFLIASIIATIGAIFTTVGVGKVILKAEAGFIHTIIASVLIQSVGALLYALGSDEVQDVIRSYFPKKKKKWSDDSCSSSDSDGDASKEKKKRKKKKKNKTTVVVEIQKRRPKTGRSRRNSRKQMIKNNYLKSTKKNAQMEEIEMPTMMDNNQFTRQQIMTSPPPSPPAYPIIPSPIIAPPTPEAPPLPLETNLPFAVPVVQQFSAEIPPVKEVINNNDNIQGGIGTPTDKQQKRNERVFTKMATIAEISQNTGLVPSKGGKPLATPDENDDVISSKSTPEV